MTTPTGRTPPRTPRGRAGTVPPPPPGHVWRVYSTAFSVVGGKTLPLGGVR